MDEEIQGHLAIVTREIGVGTTGEISYEHMGNTRRLTARATGSTPLARGTEVVIDTIENGVAEVEEWTTVERRL
jgi:hypothetical protein